MPNKAKIGILGAGNIGGTLGKQWLRAGHEVWLGVRDPDAPKYVELAGALGPKARLATPEAAADFGEVILIAIPGTAVAGTVQQLAAALDGKTLIDASNRFDLGIGNNLAAIQAAVPQALVYRAFNGYGWEVFEKPRYGSQQADLFYCGPPGQEQAVVADLISAVGLRPVYIGDLSQASILDHMAALWVGLAIREGYGRGMAFKLLQSE